METRNETPFEVGSIFTRNTADDDQLTVIVKGLFDQVPGGPARVAGEQEPLSADRFASDQPGSAPLYEDDFAPFKPCADILVLARPGLEGWQVERMQVGAQRASLDDFGPQPRRAGRRLSLAGPEGDDWFRTHWPRFRADVDWHYFNAAAEEMQSPAYLRGDEEFALDFVGKERARFAGQLPRFRVRCFLRRSDGEIEEVMMNLDTLWIEPAAARLTLIWRGRTSVDAEGMETEGAILLVGEPLDRTRPAADYEALLLSGAETEAAEGADPSAQMEAAMAEFGFDSTSMPQELQDFFGDPGGGTEGLAGLAGDGFSGPQAEGAAGVTSALASAGVSIDSAPAGLSNPVAAVASPNLAEQVGVGGPGGLAAQMEQETAALPPEIQSFLGNSESGYADLLGFLKNDDSNLVAKLVAGAEEAPQPPSFDQLAETARSVPDWPPQDAAEIESIDVLTAGFGAGRPPDGDGVGFLVVLNDFAKEPSDSVEEVEPQETLVGPAA